MTIIHPTRHLFDYHRYWLNSERTERNPAVTPDCKKLLGLKSGQPQERDSAVKHFSQMLGKSLKENPLPVENLKIYVAVVPSSKAGKWSEGLCKIAENLCRMHRNYVGASHALQRDCAIEKLATGGNRSIAVHLESISVNNRNASLLRDKSVLLLDDIATTGNSLLGCSRILEQYGVYQIYPLALGQTHE